MDREIVFNILIMVFLISLLTGFFIGVFRNFIGSLIKTAIAVWPIWILVYFLVVYPQETVTFLLVIISSVIVSCMAAFAGRQIRLKTEESIFLFWTGLGLSFAVYILATYESVNYVFGIPSFLIVFSIAVYKWCGFFKEAKNREKPLPLKITNLKITNPIEKLQAYRYKKKSFSDAWAKILNDQDRIVVKLFTGLVPEVGELNEKFDPSRISPHLMEDILRRCANQLSKKEYYLLSGSFHTAADACDIFSPKVDFSILDMFSVSRSFEKKHRKYERVGFDFSSEIKRIIMSAIANDPTIKEKHSATSKYHDGFEYYNEMSKLYADIENIVDEIIEK